MLYLHFEICVFDSLCVESGKLSGVIDNRERLLNVKRIVICACGTSWHAGLIGKYMIEDLTRKPVEVEYASEFRYRRPVIFPSDVVIAQRRGNYEKILSNIQEVNARKGRIISVITEGDTDVKALSDWYFEIPDTEECFEPILSIIPLQLLAYHIAIAKGRDVDQPRNLAKSVTVE